MSEPIRCPDCGHPNSPEAAFCEACHYPLSEAAGLAATPGREVRGPARSSEEHPTIARRRPVRPRMPAQQPGLVLSLWLGVGAFCALLLVFFALRANLERAKPQVEGSSAEQQQLADRLHAALERDSTDTHARVALADLLFDTANWSEAIIHYRSAVRHDSSLVPAIVDLGVCYYNLSVPLEAERLFRLALAREPAHPFALFNLGIVSERRGELRQALEFFRRVEQSNPPENMRPALAEAIRRVSAQAGRPTPGGAAP